MNNELERSMWRFAVAVKNASSAAQELAEGFQEFGQAVSEAGAAMSVLRVAVFDSVLSAEHLEALWQAWNAPTFRLQGWQVAIFLGVVMFVIVAMLAR